MTPAQVIAGGKATTFHGANATIEGKITGILVNADDPDLQIFRERQGVETAWEDITDQIFRNGRTPKAGDWIHWEDIFFGKVITGGSGDVTIIWAERPPVA